MAAAHDLERVLNEEYPADERLEDLLQALALYAPGQGSPYVDAPALPAPMHEALAAVTRGR